MEYLGGQGLMSCCGNLEANAERIAHEGGLAFEVSEGSRLLSGFWCALLN